MALGLTSSLIHIYHPVRPITKVAEVPVRVPDKVAAQPEARVEWIR